MSDASQTQERGASPVAEQRRPFVSRRTLIWSIALGSSALASYFFYLGANPPPPKTEERLPQQLGSVTPYVPPEFIVPPRPQPQPQPDRAPPPMPQAHIQPAAASLPLPHNPQPMVSLDLSKLKPPAELKPNMVSYDDPATKAAAKTNGEDQAGGGAQAGVPHIAYATSKVGGVKAGLTGDQTLLLMPGLMPCVLDTAINSDLPGPVMCHLAQDVRPHGVTLLDRGSTIYGFYKNDVRNGQSRLAVAADWINDPVTGCYVSFDNAPMADDQGRSGLPGHVDNHYFERFGAAVVLSLVDAGLGVLQSALSAGGNTYLSFNGGGEMNGVASQILRKQIDIPPTITKNQGELIAVFINKPLDFSGCYELKDAK